MPSDPARDPQSGDDTPSAKREAYVDFLRASSLLVVVVWHWVFTIFEADPGGTFRPTSPLAFYQNVWILTWALQVMPVFFFVGGFAHTIAWSRMESRGGGWSTFIAARLRRLLLPALVLVGLAIVIGAVVVLTRGETWAFSVFVFLLAPLWFLVIYSMLVVLAPAAIGLHRRWGGIVLVFLAGSVALVDLLRFAYGHEFVAWANLVLVWAFVHQIGFQYGTLRDGPRRHAWMLAWAGLFSLVVLTNTGVYPKSMVGVPTDHISNMGPPTMAIVALAVFQAGMVILIRPWVIARLTTRRSWQRFNQQANRYAMPVYLFHTTGYVIAYGLAILLFDYFQPSEPDPVWWFTRPLWIILPALFTIPIIYAFSSLMGGRERATPTRA